MFKAYITNAGGFRIVFSLVDGLILGDFISFIIAGQSFTNLPVTEKATTDSQLTGGLSGVATLTETQYNEILLHTSTTIGTLSFLDVADVQLYNSADLPLLGDGLGLVYQASAFSGATNGIILSIPSATNITAGQDTTLVIGGVILEGLTVNRVFNSAFSALLVSSGDVAEVLLTQDQIDSIIPLAEDTLTEDEVDYYYYTNEDVVWYLNTEVPMLTSEVVDGTLDNQFPPKIDLFGLSSNNIIESRDEETEELFLIATPAIRQLYNFPERLDSGVNDFASTLYDATLITGGRQVFAGHFYFVRSIVRQNGEVIYVGRITSLEQALSRRLVGVSLASNQNNAWNDFEFTYSEANAITSFDRTSAGGSNPFDSVSTNPLDNGSIVAIDVDLGWDGKLAADETPIAVPITIADTGEVSTEMIAPFGYVSKSSAIGSRRNDLTPMRIAQLAWAVRERDVVEVILKQSEVDYSLGDLNDIEFDNNYIAFFGKDGLITARNTSIRDGFSVSDSDTEQIVIPAAAVATAGTISYTNFTLNFDEIFSNVAGNYSADTEAYTAPRTGNYELQSSVQFLNSVLTQEYPDGLNLQSDPRVEWRLSFVVNSNIIGTPRTGSYNAFDPSTISRVLNNTLNLNAGDQVTVVLGVALVYTTNEPSFNSNFVQEIRTRVFLTNAVPETSEDAVTINYNEFVDVAEKSIDHLRDILGNSQLAIVSDGDNGVTIRRKRNWKSEGPLIDDQATPFIDRSVPIVKTYIAHDQPAVLTFQNTPDNTLYNQLITESTQGRSYGAFERVEPQHVNKTEKVNQFIYGPCIPLGAQLLPTRVSGDSVDAAYIEPIEDVTSAMPMAIYSRGEAGDRSYFKARPIRGFRHAWDLHADDIFRLGVPLTNTLVSRAAYLSPCSVEPQNDALGTTTNQLYSTTDENSPNLNNDTIFALHKRGETNYERYIQPVTDELYDNENWRIQANIIIDPDFISRITEEANTNFRIGGNYFQRGKMLGLDLSKPTSVAVEFVSNLGSPDSLLNVLTIEPSATNLDSNSHNLSFTVLHTDVVTVVSPDIIVTPVLLQLATSGVNRTAIQAVVPANSTGAERQFTITVTQGELTATATITQTVSTVEVLIVEPATAIASRVNGAAEFNVTHNQNVTVTAIDDFITISTLIGGGSDLNVTEAGVTQTDRVVILLTGTDLIRTGTVRVDSDVSGLFRTFVVTQQQEDDTEDDGAVLMPPEITSVSVSPTNPMIGDDVTISVRAIRATSTLWFSGYTTFLEEFTEFERAASDLTILNVSRGQDGRFQVSASNAAGTVTAEVSYNIADADDETLYAVINITDITGGDFIDGDPPSASIGTNRPFTISFRGPLNQDWVATSTVFVPRTSLTGNFGGTGSGTVTFDAPGDTVIGSITIAETDGGSSETALIEAESDTFGTILVSPTVVNQSSGGGEAAIQVISAPLAGATVTKFSGHDNINTVEEVPFTISGSSQVINFAIRSNTNTSTVSRTARFAVTDATGREFVTINQAASLPATTANIIGRGSLLVIETNGGFFPIEVYADGVFHATLVGLGSDASITSAIGLFGNPGGEPADNATINVSHTGNTAMQNVRGFLKIWAGDINDGEVTELASLPIDVEVDTEGGEPPTETEYTVTTQGRFTGTGVRVGIVITEATATGPQSESYSLTPTVAVASGYTATTPLTIVPSPPFTGPFFTDDTINYSITGVVVLDGVAPPDPDPTFTVSTSTTGNISGEGNQHTISEASTTGVIGTNYSLLPSISLATGFEWTSGPSFSPNSPVSGSITGNATIPFTITGTVGQIQGGDPGPTTYTATYNLTNSIVGGTLVTGSTPPAQTGTTGQSYSFTDVSIVPATGFSGAISIGGDSLTGTFGSSNIIVRRTATGTVTEDAPEPDPNNAPTATLTETTVGPYYLDFMPIFRLQTSDADGDDVSWTLSGSREGTLDSGTAIGGTLNVLRSPTQGAGRQQINFSAGDGNGGNTSAGGIVITINDSNSP